MAGSTGDRDARAVRPEVVSEQCDSVTTLEITVVGNAKLLQCLGAQTCSTMTRTPVKPPHTRQATVTETRIHHDGKHRRGHSAAWAKGKGATPYLAVSTRPLRWQSIGSTALCGVSTTTSARRSLAQRWLPAGLHSPRHARSSVLHPHNGDRSQYTYRTMLTIPVPCRNGTQPRTAADCRPTHPHPPRTTRIQSILAPWPDWPNSTGRTRIWVKFSCRAGAVSLNGKSGT